ncbi:heterokaryon incompatibility protein-domain-containing protein [Daedaleopsis nitida]|nr:heterokaryon incompatibility protein-domain-containing protein [Daedaleopsis nitida]
MWLLSTARAELRYFSSARNAAKQGYAILSHVWGEKEQTFQETEVLRVQCATDDTNPRDYSTPKVRDSCIFAERHGYKWIWDDTCCIDKTSSSELSEAINSMFSYYSLADVCYAYLEDVHCTSDAVPQDVSGSLRSQYWALMSAAWFKRGWTLQELIAPDQVLFLSQEWTVIGTKADLADDLERIAGIPRSVLRQEADVSDFSVAQRMSWAAERRTSREEDEAYCLMGLFGVNMPTVYGEGGKAFRRLQEEILKKTIDTSLFAWGDIVEHPCHSAPGHSEYDQSEMYLFATAPSDFRYCSQRIYDANVMKRLGIPEAHVRLHQSIYMSNRMCLTTRPCMPSYRAPTCSRC